MYDETMQAAAGRTDERNIAMIYLANATGSLNKQYVADIEKGGRYIGRVIVETANKSQRVLVRIDGLERFERRYGAGKRISSDAVYHLVSDIAAGRVA